MRVTITDIAKRAKVSPSTVSRVIADNPRISAATKEKVLRIMKEMNYHPNIIARSLVNQTTKIIGVVMPGMAEQSLQHPFYPELLGGIASMANNQGYKIHGQRVLTVDEEREMVKELTGDFVEDYPSNITDDNPTVDQLNKNGFPLS